MAQQKYYSFVPGTKGRKAGKQFPHMWKTGSDPVTHDKYYAWLKHKAQANYRGEPYALTWEDWQHFWTTTNWLQRGRARDDLVLTRYDHGGEWSLSNCVIMTRIEHLRSKVQGTNGFPTPARRGPSTK